MTTFNIGKDFNTGQKKHAVPAGAETVASPRNSRFDGYKAVYKALCGREVWQPLDRTDYQPLPWAVAPGSFGSCKTCERLAESAEAAPQKNEVEA